MSTSPPPLDIRTLHYAYGRHVALNGLSFSLAQGTFTVLLGLNGAGKTTLFSLITHLYTLQRGTISLFGYDLARQSLKALPFMGVVFQQPTLDLDLSVYQNLRYHAALHGMAPSLAKQRIAEELERASLQKLANDKTRRLSGGQRRRVEIARMLLHRPRLLLLDEPTVGLDIESRQNILSHVRHLCQHETITVLWATHLIDEIDKSEKVIVLHQGQLLAQGDSQHITKQTKTASIRQAFDVLVGLAPQT
ncbi:MAG: ATP-binding cassette domain-containing protein [Alphaproteobacteria bacterium GM202ARS2]|nr:ATP-binding cassette domain-containing protein [Alphaproteobacteria bacterium GM202ARS2]